MKKLTCGCRKPAPPGQMLNVKHGTRRMHLGGVTAHPTGDWTVDPKPELIVIDLQKGIVDAPTVHPPERSSSGLRTASNAPFPSSARPPRPPRSSTSWGGRNDAPRHAPQEPPRERHPFGVEPPEPAGTRTAHRDERRLRGTQSIPRELAGKRVGGNNVSPDLSWSPPPPETTELVLVLEDLDVPHIQASRALPGADRSVPAPLAQSPTPRRAVGKSARRRGTDPAIHNEWGIPRTRADQGPRATSLHIPSLRPLKRSQHHP